VVVSTFSVRERKPPRRQSRALSGQRPTTLRHHWLRACAPSCRLLRLQRRKSGTVQRHARQCRVATQVGTTIRPACNSVRCESSRFPASEASQDQSRHVAKSVSRQTLYTPFTNERLRMQPPATAAPGESTFNILFQNCPKRHSLYERPPAINLRPLCPAVLCCRLNNAHACSPSSCASCGILAKVWDMTNTRQSR
jgi:hypothetical protein